MIRAYRVRAGKGAAEVAERLGLNAAWYDDLERYDDELASTLTLFQAMDLASILGVRLRDLLDERPLDKESISIAELPARIQAQIASEGMSMEQFESQVGWELQEFLHSPLKAAAQLPIIFIQAVAGSLGIHWLSLVPDEHVA